MARVILCSSSSASIAAFLLLLTACLLQVTTFTKATPVNQPPRWRLVSLLTGQYLAVSNSDGTVHADGNLQQKDTDLIFERVSEHPETEVRIRRRDTSTYIAVTPKGKLIAINGNSESTLFTVSQKDVNYVPHYIFSTTVQYTLPENSTGNDSDHDTATPTTTLCEDQTLPPSAEATTEEVTCYIAIASPYTGEPPSNVCNVSGNAFGFEEENLLFFRGD